MLKTNDLLPSFFPTFRSLKWVKYEPPEDDPAYSMRNGWTGDTFGELLSALKSKDSRAEAYKIKYLTKNRNYKVKQLDEFIFDAIIAFTKLLMGGEIMGVLSYVLFAIFWILCSICTRVQDFMEVMTEEIEDESAVQQSS